MLIERAATTLALGRLLDRHAESVERQAHGTIIARILAHAYSDPQEAAARARALGVPLSGRRLLGVVLRHRGPGTPAPPVGELSALAETAAAACKDARLAALVGVLDEGGPHARVGVLASLPARADAATALTEVATRIRKQSGGTVMAAGSVVETIQDVRRSFLEAEQVADVAARGSGARLFYRLPDLRLRGLLHLLRDDARVQTFVERELGPLLEYDAQRGATSPASWSSTSNRAGTRPSRRSRRTCRVPPSTSGCAASSASSTPTSTTWSRACRSMSPCWR